MYATTSNKTPNPEHMIHHEGYDFNKYLIPAYGVKKTIDGMINQSAENARFETKYPIIPRTI